MIVNLVVEGASDTEAASAIARFAGHEVGRVVEKNGKGNLDPDIPKYNRAAVWAPWIVFRDTDGRCPVELRDELMRDVTEPAPLFRLRLAHSMTEAWLMGDRAGFARFFHLSEARVAPDPDALPHAKQELLNLCLHSRARSIRERIVTENGEVGPLYVPTINEFARDSWNVAAAADRSDSLARAIERLRDL